MIEQNLYKKCGGFRVICLNSGQYHSSLAADTNSLLDLYFVVGVVVVAVVVGVLVVSIYFFQFALFLNMKIQPFARKKINDRQRERTQISLS